MKKSAAMGIDGSCNHRRRGSNHLIDIVDPNSGGLVDFEVVERSSRWKSENHRGSCNRMEVEEMKQAVCRWKDNQK
jgi:hypothetical protein